MHRALYPTRSLVLPMLVSLGFAVGCTGSVDQQPEGYTPGTPGGGNSSGTPGGNSGGGVPGAGGGSVGSGGSGNAPSNGGTGLTGPECTVPGYPAAKRIVRLSFNQVANSIGSLVDKAFGAKVVTDFELLDAEHRAFPPLQSPREGNSLTDQSWGTIDRIAQAAGKYVFDNFAKATTCTETDDACAQKYVTAFAQKAYRRPLTAEEQTRLTKLYSTDLRMGAGATVPEAVQHAVYALLQTPQFLYRTEFGADWKTDGKLTSYEIASMLSYFLTDDGPDADLLSAAAQDKLTAPADIAPHVDRILKSQPARTNLEGAMISYFSYPNLESQVIQDPAFTGTMRGSMYTEAKMFLQKNLWNGTLNDLLLSRKAYINATLAPIYGIAQFPPAGATLDANMYAEVELPANRTGLLTQPGFLANRSRPDGTSVVGRGLLVKNALLCTITPPPPEGIAEQIEAVGKSNPDATERELAGIRGTMVPCNGCHQSFDAYGLALDTFDVLGRFRDKDAKGKMIDPAVTLPSQVGGGNAKDIVEVAQKLAASGAFGKCMGTNLVNYALADVSSGAASIDSCAVDEIAKTFNETDRTFPSLVKAVATSEAFAGRSKGDAK